MAEERPMTVKERMAALAAAQQASSSNSGVAATSPAAPRRSIKDKVAVFNSGGSADAPPPPMKSPAGYAPHPPGVSPPGIQTKLQAFNSASSELSENHPPQSPLSLSREDTPQVPNLDPQHYQPNATTGRLAGAPAVGGARPSAGSQRMQPIDAGFSPEPSPGPDDTRRPTSGKMSPSLRDKIQALNSASSTGSAAPVPPSPNAAASPRRTVVSPGLALKMQALGSNTSAAEEAGEPTEEDLAKKERIKRMTGMGQRMPGMGFPIPGVMPEGGLAALKRGAGAQTPRSGEAGGAPATPEGETEGPAPGELTHANLTRATMPQRRRAPSKVSRPFKASSENKEAPGEVKPAAMEAKDAALPNAEEDSHDDKAVEPEPEPINDAAPAAEA